MIRGWAINLKKVILRLIFRLDPKRYLANPIPRVSRESGATMLENISIVADAKLGIGILKKLTINPSIIPITIGFLRTPLKVRMKPLKESEPCSAHSIAKDTRLHSSNALKEIINAETAIASSPINSMISGIPIMTLLEKIPPIPKTELS